MLVAMHRKRVETWVLNSRLCMLIGNLQKQVAAFGDKGNLKPYTVEDFLPFKISQEGRVDPQEEARLAWKRALQADRAKTDRTNAKRKLQGLPPLDYKV